MKPSKPSTWLFVVGCLVVPLGLSGSILVAALRHKDSRTRATVYVHQADPELDAAVRRARASVGRFIKLLDNPPPEAEHFAIKARLTQGSLAEFVWVNRLRYADGVFHGTVAEAPALVTDVRKGDPIDVPKGEIADWIIQYKTADGGVRYEGDEINKVLMKRQGPDALR